MPRCLLLLCVFLLASRCCQPVSASAEEETKEGPTRVLLIGHQLDHPWGTHMYLHTLDVLARCLRQTDGVETIVSDRWPRDPKQLEGVKTIVVYSGPAAELLLEGPHRAEVDRLMKQGVGLVTIHWASSIQQANFDRLGKQWMSYLGGTWISNVGLSTDTSPLKQLAPDHPICRGWKEYELRDEFYLNPTIGKDALPLLKVRTRDQDVVVAWAYERPDGGRAYGTTLGHFYDNFQMDAFRQAIVNAILWTAHREVPPGGAPMALSEEQLALPPKP